MVPFVRTADNLADFFTKPLSAKVFFPMRDTIMSLEPPAIAESIGFILELRFAADSMHAVRN